MGEQLSDLTHLLLVVVPSLVVGLAVTVLLGLSVPLVMQRRLPKLSWPGDGESEPRPRPADRYHGPQTITAAGRPLPRPADDYHGPRM